MPLSPFSPQPWHLRIALATVLLALSSMGAFAQVVKRQGGDDDLLQRIAGTYRGLPQYYDKGSSLVTVQISGLRRTVSQDDGLSFSRLNNMLALDLGTMRYVTDGKRSLTLLRLGHMVKEDKAPEKLSVETLFPIEPRVSPPDMLTLLSAQRSWLILELMLDEGAVEQIRQTCKAVVEEERRKLGTREFRILLLDYPEGADYRLWIDAQTSLIQQMELIIDPDDWKANPELNGRDLPRVSLDSVTAMWRGIGIAQNPPRENPFELTIPKDFAESPLDVNLAPNLLWDKKLLAANFANDLPKVDLGAKDDKGYINRLVYLLRKLFGKGSEMP